MQTNYCTVGYSIFFLLLSVEWWNEIGGGNDDSTSDERKEKIVGMTNTINRGGESSSKEKKKWKAHPFFYPSNFLNSSQLHRQKCATRYSIIGSFAVVLGICSTLSSRLSSIREPDIGLIIAKVTHHMVWKVLVMKSRHWRNIIHQFQLLLLVDILSGCLVRFGRWKWWWFRGFVKKIVDKFFTVKF